MSELLELTAAQAAEGVRTGAVDAGELWSAYRERALESAPDAAQGGFRVPSPTAHA